MRGVGRDSLLRPLQQVTSHDNLGKTTESTNTIALKMSPALKSHDCHFRTISITYQKERPAFSHGEFCDSVSYEEHISKGILSKHDQQCTNTITSCWLPNALTGARLRAKNKCSRIFFLTPGCSSSSDPASAHFPALCIYFSPPALYIIYIWTVISMTSSFVYILYIYIYEQYY